MNADPDFINNIPEISLTLSWLMNATEEVLEMKATGARYWIILNQHIR